MCLADRREAPADCRRCVALRQAGQVGADRRRVRRDCFLRALGRVMRPVGPIRAQGRGCGGLAHVLPPMQRGPPGSARNRRYPRRGRHRGQHPPWAHPGNPERYRRGLNPGTASSSQGEHPHGRPLLTPNEVIRLGASLPIVMVAGEPPYLLDRINYLANAAYAGRFDPDPMHIGTGNRSIDRLQATRQLHRAQ